LMITLGLEGLLLLVVLANPSFEAAGVLLLVSEAALAGAIALVRLPWLSAVERNSMALARAHEAGHVASRLRSAKRVLVEAQWMFATAAISLIMYSLALATNTHCQATGPEDALAHTCNARFAAYCGVIGVNASFFVCSVALLSVKTRLIHMLSAETQQGLSHEQLDKLLTWEFGDPRAPPTRPGCPICLEDFKLSEKVRYLPCGHQYHDVCVDVWLSHKAECPMRCQLSPSTSGRCGRSNVRH